MKLHQMFGRRSARVPVRTRAGSTPHVERLEVRAVPASYTAANVPDLIAAINAANRDGRGGHDHAGRRQDLHADRGGQRHSDGPTGLPVIAAGEDLTIVGNGDVIERSTGRRNAGLPPASTWPPAGRSRCRTSRCKGASGPSARSRGRRGCHLQSRHPDTQRRDRPEQHGARARREPALPGAIGRSGGRRRRVLRGSAHHGRQHDPGQCRHRRQRRPMGSVYTGADPRAYPGGPGRRCPWGRRVYRRRHRLDQQFLHHGQYRPRRRRRHGGEHQGGWRAHPHAGGDGGNGFGGALYAAGGTIALRNSELTQNEATGGAGGDGPGDAADGKPGQGVGGAVYSHVDPTPAPARLGQPRHLHREPHEAQQGVHNRQRHPRTSIRRFPESGPRSRRLGPASPPD